MLDADILAKTEWKRILLSPWRAMLWQLANVHFQQSFLYLLLRVTLRTFWVG